MDDRTDAPLTSRIPGFRHLTPEARLAELGRRAGLDPDDLRALAGADALPAATADGMIENTIGKFELPLAIATNFTINGRDVLIPMAVEEPSVVAAASFMARIARPHGGFHTSADRPVMRAQVQVVGLADPYGARLRLLAAEAELTAAANACDKVLVGLGGGCTGIEVHLFDDTPAGAMLVLHLLVDVRDAMGANAVNTMAEALAPRVVELTGGEVRLRILSNLADRRLARARVEIPPEALDTADFSGAEVAARMVEACALAIVDPYRAATHNKGIMNGIDPVVLATGNDWRAIEAGAHAFAARNGRYTSLSRWEIGADGQLVGTLELPMALGLVGGATRTHPAARAALKLLGVTTAQDLAQVVVAVGLAQNMAALRALATEGIQRGHMALHARNLAIAAGATGPEIDRIAAAMVKARDISAAAAQRLLAGGD
ncbi:MAG TPA: hydroxymethylglutaryl-CoA reductase, degradative [Aliiroseovarius sp.]|nr:hydroxymethylglutaryl-CoA reductase, degradative [Aliiroseovarius sp.]